VDTPDAPPEPVSLGVVDQKDFRHDYYLELIRGLLARAWNPPDGGSGLLLTSLHFNILRDGTIIEPEIVSPSGWSLYDRAALGSVMTVRKLPPLPEAYAGEQLGLTVNFRRMGQEP
jgi:TonB family protein